MNTISTWEASRRLVGIDRAVVSMERRGFSIDADFCVRQAEQAARDEIESLDRLRALAAELGQEVPDEVWSSHPQLAELLHDRLRWPRSPIHKKGRTKPGKTSLDGTALDWIKHRVPEGKALLDELIQLKRIRLCGDWLRKLPDYVAPDGRVHPVCGPAGDGDSRIGAKTGRLGIKNPSSNFPKDDETEDTKDPYGVRRAIVARPGNRIIEVDYQALEVFIQADMFVHLFDDWTLANKLLGPDDIHSVTARDVFGVQLGRSLPDGRLIAELPLAAFKDDNDPEAKACRFNVKEVRYGKSYGKTPFGFGITLKNARGEPLGVPGAEVVLAAFARAEPGQAKFESWVWDVIRRDRMMVSYAGRVMDFSDLIPGDEWQEAKAHRRALNIPQAHAADVIGLAMVFIETEGRLAALGWGMILQIHDSIVAEGPEETADEALAVIREAMERAGREWMQLPLRTSGGHGVNFGEC